MDGELIFDRSLRVLWDFGGRVVHMVIVESGLDFVLRSVNNIRVCEFVSSDW